MTEILSGEIVRNFGKCRKEQFERVRADLGVSLSDACLSACSVYFAEQARRDPLVGELRLWDRLSSLPAPTSAVCFTQLDTNDAAIAETYADMMNKRRELRPTGNIPMSVGEALGLAGAALARGGKTPALHGSPMLLSDAESHGIGANCVGANGSSAVLCLFGKDALAGAASVGDVFVLIRRGSLLPHAFRKAMRELLNTERFSNQLRGALPISEGGVLPLLLSIATGLYIDLTRMGSGKETSIEMLAGEYAGDWLAILPKDRSETVLKMIADVGMQGVMFAAITEGAETVIVTYEKRRLAVQTAFLRGFFRMPTASVVLKDEKSGDTVSRFPVTRASCRYWAEDGTSYATVNCGEVTVSAGSASPINAPFRTALITALSAVLTLAAAGGDYAESRFAVDLAIPKNEADFGETLAAVLGIYRAEAELGIPAAAQRIRETSADHAALTVFSVEKSRSAPPCRLTRSGDSLFLVAARMNGNGLPDFAALRSMLNAVRSIARSGRIHSVRVLAIVTATDALRAMKTATLSARLIDNTIASGEPIPLALLIESDADLPFARIATVAEETAETVIAQPLRIPHGNGLIFRSETEIAILAAPEDVDAQLLADRLAECGIAATVYPQNEVGPFSRAMLTANAVFVCAGAKWPLDEQTAFAHSMLERNGGVVISLGEWDAIPAKIDHQHFSNGLSLVI